MDYIFDIGGMSSKFEIYDGDKKVKSGNFIYEKFVNNFEIIEIIDNIITKNQDKFPITVIGISSPGIVDPVSGQISGLAAIENYHLVNWKTELQKWTNQVFIENDANCAALAELSSGNAKNFSNVLFLVIGTGIGGSLIIDKKLYSGSFLQAGEIGCGLEFIEDNNYYNSSTQCSTNALINFYQKLTYEKKTGEEIMKNYQTDKAARTAVDKMVFNIAKLIMNSAFLIDPQLVLIGGGISQSSLLIELVTIKIDEILKLTNLKRNYEIKSCYYYNEANLIGARALTKEK
ncbi:ROK family protein [Spiroplasma endosymbiont of Panorpa germanica]|uniref:ROK family protein n=1 Tax=Spiroplasma endosymbiont of Panorpa germanica TaxID=3066314 RepID=UPI0030D0AD65